MSNLYNLTKKPKINLAPLHKSFKKLHKFYIKIHNKSIMNYKTTKNFIFLLALTICISALTIIMPLSINKACATEYFLQYAPATYTVQPGDSMWKIANRYEIGLNELKLANPQIKDFSLIFVGQKINIPEASPLKTLEEDVFKLVNKERVNYGLQPLKYNWQAARVARIKSQDMIDNKYFSHISPVYGSPFKMLESYGLKFSSAAENIAYGQRSAHDVMKSWMNSPGHKANILSKTVSEIGVGAAKDSKGTIYFTQLFLKPL